MKTINIEIKMASGRTIKAELYPEVAPVTVENFVNLCKSHFYDGLIFHRVSAGFMIQGGGDDINMRHHEAQSIVGEFAANGYENHLKHTPGVLSMARTMVPDSASSQFFIMHQAAPHLDGQYAAFGQVTEGMDVVNDIANVATDMNDRPLGSVVIESIRVI